MGSDAILAKTYTEKNYPVLLLTDTIMAPSENRKDYPDGESAWIFDEIVEAGKKDKYDKDIVKLLTCAGDGDRHRHHPFKHRLSPQLAPVTSTLPF